MRVGNRAARLLVVAGSIALGGIGASGQSAPAPELPRPALDVPGVTPEVLSRTAVPGAPWKIAIATRVVYQPGARVRKHYHTSQVVFYILEGEWLCRMKERSRSRSNPVIRSSSS